MTVSRRTFVRGSLAAGTVAGTGLIQIGCGNDVAPAPLAPKQLLDTDATTGVRSFTLDVARYPDLQPVGGALTVPFLPIAPGVPLQPDVLLVHRGTALDPPEYVAMASECPHLGCPLGYSLKDKLVECPCHGSRFDPTTGAVRHLPAKQGPEQYAVQLNGSILTVTLSCAPFVTMVTFAVHPELMTPGSAVLIESPESICPIVVSRSATGASAVDARCTHQRCIVGVLGARLECPCHGSQFDFDGVQLRGPSGTTLTGPLRKYVAVVEADGIRVTGG